MTKEQALTILKQPDRIGCHLIKANDEESNKYNQESIEALNMAIKALEQNNEEIYKAGYEDGVHDGYYSSLIEDGTEEKHFGKSYQEQPTSDDCVSRQAVEQIYIVINVRINADGINSGYCINPSYCIDSVWTSKRKAQKRCDELNAKLEEKPIYGIGLYQVEQKFVSTH